ncbi:hypothetical protein B296_00035304 [Ensete ventricosum]|uniref:Uncharacterized protein n=1 Tax=Ensete ventricosum TaxID=4639 RepID=A0A426ZE05_ENSVE|nr:hypothetical protein B296_00035304 [Ensete ventricosum]
MQKNLTVVIVSALLVAPLFKWPVWKQEESISSPIAAQILDFCDGDVGGDLFSPPDIALLRFTDDVNAEASATTPLPCYADDASFSPFPSPLDSATLSALLDAPSAHLPDPEADVVLPAASSPLNPPLAMFPASPPYAGEHHLGPFDDQISIGDAATSGYRPYSPDPAAARGPPSCQQQRRTASDEEYYAAAAVTAMQQTLGFAGMEPAPTCGLLEGGGVGALYYRGGMAGEDGRDAFFYTGDMMAAAPGASFVGPTDVADYHRLDGVLGLYVKAIRSDTNLKPSHRSELPPAKEIVPHGKLWHEPYPQGTIIEGRGLRVLEQIDDAKASHALAAPSKGSCSSKEGFGALDFAVSELDHDQEGLVGLFVIGLANGRRKV